MTEDHGFPDREHAAERYLLGEMSAADRERYEEHFFACAECAADVRTTATFLEDVRKYVVPRFPAQTAVPVSPAVRTPAAWYRSTMVPWALAASLLLFTAYRSLVPLPGRDDPRALYYATLRPESRGQVPIIHTSDLKLRDGAALVLDVNDVQPEVILEYKMTTPGGRELASETTAPRVGESLLLSFSQSDLRELGRYQVSIREAATRREIGVYPFEREN